jgi:hypothetical protein
VRNDNRAAKLVKLIATCGPLDVDDPQPAITLMMPDRRLTHYTAGPVTSSRFLRAAKKGKPSGLLTWHPQEPKAAHPNA